MRNIRNLVFIKHNNSAKQFLFEVPLSVQLVKGDKVFCDTIHGCQLGICESDSFLVDIKAAEHIVNAFGAYEPLKMVISYATEEKVYKRTPFAIPF